MSTAEFRKQGKAIVDWLADYLEQVESYPVLSQVSPGEIRSQLPQEPPAQGESFEHILQDVQQIIMPGITHWQSPNFFAYFPANVSGPSILGEMISAGLGVQGMLWSTSPACTELETHVLDWVADMLALPPKFKSSGSGGGVIQDSASSAVICALIAARERATNFKSNEQGTDGCLTVYASSQVHSSLEKGVRIAGLGNNNLRLIEVDQEFAMKPELLERQIREDTQNGYTPCLVCANVGSTSSTALDPLQAIGKICREHEVWLHVDAAMGGSAAVCPEFRHIQQGVELADSYCFNPHKWMFTNFDCDCFFVADREALVRSLTILPEYLRNQATESGEVIDYRDWQIPLGRRFRALKLWFVIRHYGVEGLRHHIRQHIQWASELARCIEESEDFELFLPPALNLVCFRHMAGDDFNQRLLDRLNNSGRVFLTHTRLNRKFILRMCISQTHTTREHVQAAWDLIQSTAGEMNKK